MKTAVIIPSRYASVRLPKKPLHPIGGISLIQRVFERCRQAEGIDALYIATDHEEIARHAESCGAQVIMTDAACASGTDRVAAAAKSLPAEFDVVINVQGDEPLIKPEVIEALARTMRSALQIVVGTPITEIRNPDDLGNPNVVKVVRTQWGDALYFSRQSIPYLRDFHALASPELLAQHRFWKHIGLYAYRRSALEQYSLLQESSLERAERLEQLRLLEAGIPIRCVEVEYESVAVDTIEDVYAVEKILAEQGLR